MAGVMVVCPECEGSGTLVSYAIACGRGKDGTREQHRIPFPRQCDVCGGTGEFPDSCPCGAVPGEGHQPSCASENPS